LAANRTLPPERFSARHRRVKAPRSYNPGLERIHIQVAHNDRSRVAGLAFGLRNRFSPLGGRKYLAAFA
jgi:hypothetical protein